MATDPAAGDGLDQLLNDLAAPEPPGRADPVPTAADYLRAARMAAMWAGAHGKPAPAPVDPEDLNTEQFQRYRQQIDAAVRAALDSGDPAQVAYATPAGEAEWPVVEVTFDHRLAASTDPVPLLATAVADDVSARLWADGGQLRLEVTADRGDTARLLYFQLHVPPPDPGPDRLVAAEGFLGIPPARGRYPTLLAPFLTAVGRAALSTVARWAAVFGLTPVDRVRPEDEPLLRVSLERQPRFGAEVLAAALAGIRRLRPADQPADRA